MTRTVVIAIDSSPLSRYAFDWAMDRVYNNEKDELLLLHVQEFEKASPAYYVGLNAYSALAEAQHLNSEEDVQPEALLVLNNYMHLCQERNIRTFRHELIPYTSNPGAAICSFVTKLMEKTNTGEDRGNEMTLVLGSRELGFFGRAFLGSTSDYCVTHCPCPVIVVKKTPENTKAESAAPAESGETIIV
jgi:nucleotide-binding universal stress UspA family protein